MSGIYEERIAAARRALDDGLDPMEAFYNIDGLIPGDEAHYVGNNLGRLYLTDCVGRVCTVLRMDGLVIYAKSGTDLIIDNVLNFRKVIP